MGGSAPRPAPLTLSKTSTMTVVTEEDQQRLDQIARWSAANRSGHGLFAASADAAVHVFHLGWPWLGASDPRTGY